jgi:hypothetical protein
VFSSRNLVSTQSVGRLHDEDLCAGHFVCVLPGKTRRRVQCGTSTEGAEEVT